MAPQLHEIRNKIHQLYQTLINKLVMYLLNFKNTINGVNMNIGQM
jgi:hypothetical protein